MESFVVIKAQECDAYAMCIRLLLTALVFLYVEVDSSPLTPLWVEQYLHAGRDTSALGLQLGFRPHQLDDRPAAISTDHATLTIPPQGPRVLSASSRVDSHVLARSEFLLPLPDSMLDLYKRALTPLSPSTQPVV